MCTHTLYTYMCMLTLSPLGGVNKYLHECMHTHILSLSHTQIYICMYIHTHSLSLTHTHIHIILTYQHVYTYSHIQCQVLALKDNVATANSSIALLEKALRSLLSFT